jgi:hypothetical protein
VTVRHDLGAADVEGLMNGPGVQYVRH